jgi:TonB-linked SusC/RagA family outer membrane protein
MRKKIPHFARFLFRNAGWLLLAIMWLIPGHTFSQSLASADKIWQDKASKQNQSDLRPLKEVLTELEVTYKVHFGFEGKIIEDILIEDILIDKKLVEKQQNSSLEEKLNSLLQPLNLKHEKLMDNNYVIYSQEKEEIKKIEGNYQNSLEEDGLLQKGYNLLKRQAINVSGKVTTETGGTELPGVNILVKGTGLGTITDLDGNYNINVPNENDTLVFSSIGYITKEVPVNSQSVINIALVEDIQSLEEVVVVGYGSKLKREITGSIQTLNGEELQDIPVSQLTQKLQGRLAGVQINQTTGKPGQGMSVRIRGQLSVSADSDPLYVIDGFPVTGNIGDLNPDEIQEITILKDAASTSLYGSRAANGVVLITTKQGRSGQTNVSFNTYVGIQQVPERGRLEMMNAVEFAQFKKEYYEDAGQDVPEAFQNPSQYEGKSNDWYGALLRTAPIQSYNLTITSNKDKLSTALIAGVFDQKGVVLNSPYRRYSLRLNTDYDVSDKVRIGFNIAPSYIKDNIPRTDGSRGVGILFNALHTWPIMPIYDENGELTLFNSYPPETGNVFDYPNWVRSAQELVNETKSTNILSNAYIEFEPIKDLVLRSTFNAQLYNSNFFFFSPSTATSSINRPIPTTASSVRSNVENFTWLNENLATYSRSFNDHDFELLAGFTHQRFHQDYSQIATDTYADDRIRTIQGASNIDQSGTNSNVQEWSLSSVLSRLTYNYKGKYFFTAAVRSDGSSRFGSQNRWGTFPSASVGWIVSDENFLQNMSTISFAKIRASYGVTGNNNIGNYTHYARINTDVGAVFGDNVVPGAVTVSLGNSNLGWETTKQFDVGLDLGLFKDRIQFVYDYYQKQTTNMLYDVRVPGESGFGSLSDNVGEIEFWGHEFALTTINTGGKLKWTTNANISFNRNKVVALAEGIDNIYGNLHITQVGEPVGQFYGHIADGVYMNAEDLASSPQIPGSSTVGSIKFLDINGDGILTEDNDDRAIMGSPFPDFTYGIINTLRYGNFDFSIVGSGSYGNQLLVRHLFSTANLDGVFNVLKDVKYRFRSEENPGRGFFGTTVGGGNVTGPERDWVNSRFVADASYFTIRNITLGYTFGGINKFFNSARFYASVQNVYVFTKYWGGPNPETSAQENGQGDGGNLNQGVDLSNYPVPRIVSIGVNVNF